MGAESRSDSRWQQIEHLFEAAHSLAPADRGAFLMRTAPQDPELRAEVESLLRAADEQTSFLNDGPLPRGSRIGDGLQAGDTLGSFQVSAVLGRGGMGDVWRARDLRLNRDVAIKVLHADFAHDRDRAERLRREAKAVASLNHPHICSLYDVGTHDGVDFLVMELVEGETLAARLRKGALSLSDALQFAIQIADAVAAA